jgi:hypothetical protein
MALAVLVLLLSLVATFDILPYHGSTISLLVIALIAIVALAIFRFLIPLIIAVVIAIVLVILLFGGIPFRLPHSGAIGGCLMIVFCIIIAELYSG